MSGSFTALLCLAAAAMLSVNAPGAASAESIADKSRVVTTDDGWQLRVTKTRENLDRVPNLAATTFTREGFVSLGAVADVTGHGRSPLKSSSVTIGYQIGCQVDVSNGLAAGLSVIVGPSFGIGVTQNTPTPGADTANNTSATPSPAINVGGGAIPSLSPTINEGGGALGSPSTPVVVGGAGTPHVSGSTPMPSGGGGTGIPGVGVGPGMPSVGDGNGMPSVGAHPGMPKGGEGVPKTPSPTVNAGAVPNTPLGGGAAGAVNPSATVGALAVPGVSVNPRPGAITTIQLGKKGFDGPHGSVRAEQVEIKVDSCMGPVSLRSFATVAVSTATADNAVSVYSDPIWL